MCSCSPRTCGGIPDHRSAPQRQRSLAPYMRGYTVYRISSVSVKPVSPRTCGGIPDPVKVLCLKAMLAPVPAGVYLRRPRPNRGCSGSPRIYRGIPRYVKLAGMDIKFTPYLRGYTSVGYMPLQPVMARPVATGVYLSRVVRKRPRARSPRTYGDAPT